VAPLKPAEGAIVVDSTSMSIEAVVDSILGEVERLGLTD
jgi:cytidylate kinase